jgi:hypothetical protein
MVFLSGNRGYGAPTGQPENVERVVNILPDGRQASGSEPDYAEDARLADTSHFGAPRHPGTLHRLAEELASIAAAVPVTEPALPVLPPSPEQAPTPRPVKAKAPAAPDEWDFLKPVSHLGPIDTNPKPEILNPKSQS